MDNDERGDREPLIEGLESIPEEAFQLPRPAPGLGERILARTSQVVRARARQRRMVWLGVAAATYIAGMVTAFLWTETQRKMDRHTLISALSREEEGKDESYPAHMEPSDLVLRSETASAENRVHLLKQAGDIYLYDQYEVEKALHCYRKALDALPASLQMRVEPSDSWLLAALKDARK